MVSSMKLPILKKGEYILSTIKMKQYLAHIDYALWEQILARTKERKAKGTLLMGIPDEHLARFHGIKDAKTLWAAIKTRFGEGLDKGSSQLDKKDLEQIDEDDLEEIDLKWQVAMLSMRVNRFYKKTRRKLEFNGKEPVGFDKNKVECFNCHRRGHFARDCRSAKNSRNRSRDAGNAGYIGTYKGKMLAKKEDEKVLVVQDGLGTYDWSYQVEEEATDFALMAFTSNPSSSSSSNSEGLEPIEGQLRVYQQNEVIYEEKIRVLEYQVKDKSDEENSVGNDRFKKGEGYHVVPPPLIGNYMPPKSDLSFARLDDSIYKFKISETVTSLTKDEKDEIDSDDDSVFTPEPIPAKIDFVKASEFVKHVKHVTPVKTAEQTKKSKNFSSSLKVDRTNWNGKMTQKLGLGFGFTKKACFVCGSLSHLIKDYTFHEDRMAKKFMLPTDVGKGTGHRESRPVWNNIQRINYQNNFAPTTVFTRSGRIPVSATKPKATTSTSAAKLVNTTGPK
nr:hypothetical protein [Tanacetum cinerariifolium]